MAKMTAAAATGETMTFVLAVPVEDKDQVIDTVTVIEPELRHHIEAERAAGQAESAVKLIARMTGLSEAAARKMKFRDANSIKKWVAGLIDGVEPLDCDPLVEGGPKEFKLIVPIADGAKVITSVTIQEPDIESGIAIEKFKKQHEQDAAMIAVLSGLTIPVVSKLKMRDVSRIKAWLLPFVSATDSTEEAGAT